MMFPAKATIAQSVWLITHKLDIKGLSLKNILDEKVGESGSQFGNGSQKSEDENYGEWGSQNIFRVPNFYYFFYL